MHMMCYYNGTVYAMKSQHSCVMDKALANATYLNNYSTSTICVLQALLNKVLEGRATFTNVTDTGICQPDPCGDCKNGGSCEKQPSGDYVCICTQGWTGQKCTVDVDECVRGQL